MRLDALLTDVEVLDRNADGAAEITGLSLDSRLVSPGDLFFAVPGAKADGLSFAPIALKNGAVAVVTESVKRTNGPYVFVRDVRAAMAAAAAAFYRRPWESMRLIGVTGTNGKTTVTHIVKGILERVQSAPIGLIGTNHNMIGDAATPADRTTPDILTLYRLLSDMISAGCSHCVMEVSSHSLAQRRVGGLQFREGVFTNLTQDHLDYHRDMEDYFDAKARLLDQSDAAIVNLDDPYGRRLFSAPGFGGVTYSTMQDEADVVAKNIRYKADRVEFEAVTTSDIARMEWHTPGEFSVYNALAAVACALTEGVPMRDIAAAMRDVPPVRGRMEVTPGPKNVTVLIDYAHTPDALQNVLEAIHGWHTGRVITVVGCGGDRDKGKRPKMGAIASKLSDLLVVTSDNPRTETPGQIIDQIVEGIPKDSKPIHIVEDRREAIGRALGEARPGDIVLLAGKGHEEYQEVNGVRYTMDERQIVSDWIKSRC